MIPTMTCKNIDWDGQTTPDCIKSIDANLDTKTSPKIDWLKLKMRSGATKTLIGTEGSPPASISFEGGDALATADGCATSWFAAANPSTGDILALQFTFQPDVASLATKSNTATGGSGTTSSGNNNSGGSGTTGGSGGSGGSGDNTDNSSDTGKKKEGEKKKTEESGVNAGAIAGGVIGGLAGVALIGGGIWWMMNKKPPTAVAADGKASGDVDVAPHVEMSAEQPINKEEGAQ